MASVMYKVKQKRPEYVLLMFVIFIFHKQLLYTRVTFEPITISRSMISSLLITIDLLLEDIPMVIVLFYLRRKIRAPKVQGFSLKSQIFLS